MVQNGFIEFDALFELCGDVLENPLGDMVTVLFAKLHLHVQPVQYVDAL